MSVVAPIVTLVVAALHAGFFVLESVLWAGPTGRKVFGLSAADAETTKVLASNQGVYNLALALALVWALAAQDRVALTILLAFVAGVGVYGAATVKPTIFVLQALPALIALGAWQLAG
jgi:putative membrane protein